MFPAGGWDQPCLSRLSMPASISWTARSRRAGAAISPSTGPAGSLTYAELAQRVAVFASGLRALGVRPEERVVLVTSDRPETVITFLALLRMGAVAVPVSTMYNGAELGELLRDTRARVVVATSEFAAVTREAMALAPEATVLVLAGEDGAAGDGADGGDGTGTRSWDGVLADGQRAGPAAPYGTWFDSPGFWLYTSGTTGTPKAAMHRHGSIAGVCETYAHQVLGITAGGPLLLGGQAVLRLRHRQLAVLPVLGRRHRGPRPGPRHPGRGGGPAGRGPPVAVLRRARLLRRAARRRRARGGLRLGAAGDVGGRGPARRDLPAVHRPLRGRHHRRPRLHRGAAHLHLQPARRRPRPGRRAPWSPGYEARLVDDDGEPVADGHARPPASARRLHRDRLLVPGRHHPAGVPGRVAAHRRHLHPLGRTASTPAWAGPTT